MRNQVWFSAAALLASACTTSLYNGPRRSSSQLAYLVSSDSQIDSLDGFEAPYSGGNFGRYEILPGEHEVGIALNMIANSGVRYGARNRYILCLNAKAGKQYRAQVAVDLQNSHWQAYLVEDGLTEMVNHPCRKVVTSAPEQESLLDESFDLNPRK